MMLYLSPALTILMLGILPPMSIGAVVYGRYIKKLSNATQEAIGEMTKVCPSHLQLVVSDRLSWQVAQEALSALRTVQSTNAQKQEDAKFSKRVDEVLVLAKREAVATGVFWGATGWGWNLTIVSILGYGLHPPSHYSQCGLIGYIGGTLVSKGAITVGDLTSVLFYSFYVGDGLESLTSVPALPRRFNPNPFSSSFFASLMRGVGASTRIFELLGRQPLVPRPDVGVPIQAGRRGVLRYENVNFAYPSRPDTPILTDFNLEIAVGESVAIV